MFFNATNLTIQQVTQQSLLFKISTFLSLLSKLKNWQGDTSPVLGPTVRPKLVEDDKKGPPATLVVNGREVLEPRTNLEERPQIFDAFHISQI